MLERDVARAIDAYLTDTLGLTVFRPDPRGKTRWVRPNSAGLPDRFGILPNGRMWCVEVKSPAARPRIDQSKQQATLAYLAANGALVILATSLADVHERLNPQVIADHAQHKMPYPHPAKRIGPDYFMHWYDTGHK
jgi:hypothetical protein